MKFQLSAFLALLPCLATGYQQSADIYYHNRELLGPSMWAFGADGIKIYSVDGQSVLHEHSGLELCGEADSCNFYDGLHDGKKYVVLINMQGDHHLDIFSIDSGEHVTSIPTCGTPTDLEYNPLREEASVRCASASEFTDGHIDIFSMNALGVDHEVSIQFGDGVRGYGRHETDPTLGKYGYATVYDSAFLYQFDYNTKNVTATFALEKSYGSYDMAYSQSNQHLFVRSRVCCTCGFEGADAEECGFSSSEMTLETGPFADGGTYNGTCGSTCQGTAADTIGVYEFDTVSGTFVANHNIEDGFGCNPRPSPYGDYILLPGYNGGKTLRILKTGKNGEASSVHGDVEVDFQGASSDSSSVISDYTFIQDENREILVVGASTDNEIAVIDLGDLSVVKIALSSAAETTSGSTRAVEWAVDTDYVWVGGSAAKEQYIVRIPSDISSAELVSTVSGDDSTQLLFVNNYMRLSETTTMSDALAAVNDDGDNDNTLAVVGVVLGGIAVALGFAAVGLVLSQPKSVANHPVSGDKSLASKQIE